ncbi:MAG: hypothetical protein ACK47B_28465 [Armatimonadota bacterium]
MNRRPLPLICLLALALLLPAVAAEPPYGPPEQLFKLQDPRINEASGLAASAKSDDLLFTHNDSGDGANLYAFDMQGRTLAMLRVKGAFALDWEDIARGPDESGNPSLFLADIGDNFRIRPHLTVYRIPEPAIHPSQPGRAGETAPAAAFDLRYPDGARDAEGLFVHPRTGQLFVVTKSAQGSAIFAAPVPLKPKVANTMTKLASIQFDQFGETEGSKRDPSGSRLATGADISPDGERIVIRTYTDAWEWRVKGDDVAAAFRIRPKQVPLPALRGGEAIAYSRSGDALFVTVEGGSPPVHRLQRR